MNDEGDIDEPVQRKLAAIMSADVVGYSRLMGLDEAETLRRLSDLRKVVDTLIEQRGGRIAGTGGDSVLAEFPSVVEAAACAVEIQQANGALNATHSEDRKMLLRVGLNVGDVIVQDDTIFGDGVNVAARLEAMAPAGGICISQLARDHLQDKATYTFEDLGALSLKNIARPVQAFALIHDADSTQNEPAGSEKIWLRPPQRKLHSGNRSRRALALKSMMLISNNTLRDVSVRSRRRGWQTSILLRNFLPKTP